MEAVVRVVIVLTISIGIGMSLAIQRLTVFSKFASGELKIHRILNKGQICNSVLDVNKNTYLYTKCISTEVDNGR